MSLTDLLLGRPLATREEGAERIGPAAGIPIFVLDALSSAAYGPEAALTLLIPPRPGRRWLYRADHGEHHRFARHRVSLLSPNDRCLSWRRRRLHRRSSKPRLFRWTPGGCSADDRLHSGSGSGHFGRRGS